MASSRCLDEKNDDELPQDFRYEMELKPMNKHCPLYVAPSKKRILSFNRMVEILPTYIDRDIILELFSSGYEHAQNLLLAIAEV